MVEHGDFLVRTRTVSLPPAEAWRVFVERFADWWPQAYTFSQDALAHIADVAPKMDRDQIVLMNLCGRGDKDVHTVAAALEAKADVGYLPGDPAFDDDVTGP